MGVSLKMCLSILLKEKRVDWKLESIQPIPTTQQRAGINIRTWREKK